MTILYDLAFLLVFIIYLPILCIRGKLHSGYKIRFGWLGQDIVQHIQTKKNIWFHAVSVGEVLALQDLIRRVRAKYPDYQIIITTVTQTGHATALQNSSPHDIVLYAPLDLSLVIRKFIRVIKPILYVAAETEIWPNLYRSLNKEGVEIIQVNGRISDKSFKGYKRFRWFVKKTLTRVSLFCMQSDRDASRIVEIGANKEKVKVTGNIKFDNLPEDLGIERSSMGYSKEDKIIVAGSTHPNEEPLLLQAMNQLAEEHVRLILCPRHIERAQEIQDLVKEAGFNPVVLSQLNGKKFDQKDVLIVDQIGVLRDLYSIADVVFIGKTFSVGGGQNMIEPAFFSKATIVGPLTYNFKDVVRIFLSENAIVQVSDEKQLFNELKDLINNTGLRDQIGANAKRVVDKYKGASVRTLELVTSLMPT